AVHPVRHRNGLPLPVRRDVRRAGHVRAGGDRPVHPDARLRVRVRVAPRRAGLELKGAKTMGLEEKLPNGILLASVEKLVNWTRKPSRWPAPFGLARCARARRPTRGP